MLHGALRGVLREQGVAGQQSCGALRQRAWDARQETRGVQERHEEQGEQETSEQQGWDESPPCGAAQPQG